VRTAGSRWRQGRQAKRRAGAVQAAQGGKAGARNKNVVSRWWEPAGGSGGKARQAAIPTAARLLATQKREVAIQDPGSVSCSGRCGRKPQGSMKVRQGTMQRQNPRW